MKANQPASIGISENTVVPVTDPYFAQQQMMIPSNWLPSSANINALPEPVRQYIASLETIADPTGIVRENTILRDAIAALELRVNGLTKTSEHQTKDDQIGCGGWQIVSDLLHGEKLLDSTNAAIYGLCAGTHVVVEKQPAVVVELTDIEVADAWRDGKNPLDSIRRVLAAHIAKQSGGA